MNDKLYNKAMTERDPNQPHPNGLSDEERNFLQEEADEASIQAAIDAAAEGGVQLTREEAIEMLQQSRIENPADNSTPNTNSPK